MFVKDLIEILNKPENLDKQVIVLDIESKEMFAVEDVNDVSSVVDIGIIGTW